MQSKTILNAEMFTQLYSRCSPVSSYDNEKRYKICKFNNVITAADFYYENSMQRK